MNDTLKNCLESVADGIMLAGANAAEQRLAQSNADLYAAIKQDPVRLATLITATKTFQNLMSKMDNIVNHSPRLQDGLQALSEMSEGLDTMISVIDIASALLYPILRISHSIGMAPLKFAGELVYEKAVSLYNVYRRATINKAVQLANQCRNLAALRHDMKDEILNAFVPIYTYFHRVHDLSGTLIKECEYYNENPGINTVSTLSTRFKDLEKISCEIPKFDPPAPLVTLIRLIDEINNTYHKLYTYYTTYRMFRAIVTYLGKILAKSNVIISTKNEINLDDALDKLLEIYKLSTPPKMLQELPKKVVDAPFICLISKTVKAGGWVAIVEKDKNIRPSDFERPVPKIPKLFVFGLGANLYSVRKTLDKVNVFEREVDNFIKLLEQDTFPPQIYKFGGLSIPEIVSTFLQDKYVISQYVKMAKEYFHDDLDSKREKQLIKLKELIMNYYNHHKKIDLGIDENNSYLLAAAFVLGKCGGSIVNIATRGVDKAISAIHPPHISLGGILSQIEINALVSSVTEYITQIISVFNNTFNKPIMM